MIRPISNDSIFAPPIYQSSTITKPHPPTHFYCPRNLRSKKMWFLYLNSRYLPIFFRISPVINSNMDRFRNGFHSRIAFCKLYNTVAQSFSQENLRSMKIIIETFLGDIWFPCVSSVVFEAVTTSISRNVLAPRTDTTYDSLGRKFQVGQKRKRRLF